MHTKISKRSTRSRYAQLWMVGLFTLLSIGCSDLTDTDLPDGVIGPSTYHNRHGATRITQATLNELSSAIRRYIISSGLLTDELRSLVGNDLTDRRSGRPIESPPHMVRSLARLARGVVRKYVEGETSAWQARLFLYEAYAEILIADGWCSGVPLSTLDFEGDWTYKPGSTTDQIYEHAIQLLDSGEARATDSVSLQSAIRVLKARAQVALGRYADAKQTVQGIDEEFRYDIRIAFDGGTGTGQTSNSKYGEYIARVSISDKEGINGLPYRSSDDPRTKSTPFTYLQNGQSFFPVKYITTGDSSIFTLTSGTEAQLIRAEAALYENDAQRMITILDALRTSGTYTVDTTDLEGGGEQIDTVWHAGTGGVPGLRPLGQLPATQDAQRTLLFSERAAWLFLTGSRQGDLRRLVRKYGMDSEQVYPTGVYTDPNYVSLYGTDISFSLHTSEFRNPLFKGCQYDD